MAVTSHRVRVGVVSESHAACVLVILKLVDAFVVA